MTGALVTGWGLARFSEVLVPIFKANAQQHPRSGLALTDLTGLFATFLLLGFGIVLMARFRGIHRWMGRRGGG